MSETLAKAAEPKSVLTPAEAKQLQAPMTRREFLNYAWLATLGVFTLQLGVVTYFFALPRFKKGEFGGEFDFVPDAIPAVGSPPNPDQKAKVWLSNTDKGFIALYNVCVHLGCLYAWQSVTNRFECPCHGSKYQRDGTYIEGPAPRSLDRMEIHFFDASGKELGKNDAQGSPTPIPNGTARITINTGKIISGATHG